MVTHELSRLHAWLFRIFEMISHRFHRIIAAGVLACLVHPRGQAQLAPSPFEFGFAEGMPVKIVWPGASGRYYDLWSSTNLTEWAPMDGFPKPGTATLMEQYFVPTDRQFFRMASGPSIESFFLPEVAAYKSATGITTEAANEINLFLRHLRGAGVEPVLFWVGGSRYNSVIGSTARAVIGGNGAIIEGLGPRGDRYETFTGTQAIRFPNPLKNGSQSRVGMFVGAAPSSSQGDGGLVTGGDRVGPRLAASWGAGTFRLYNTAGGTMPHPGYGGFSNANTFLPYVGGGFDGFYSVLCGIGKTSGNREFPLRNQLDPASFPNNQFVNNQDFIDLGSSFFSGKLHFAVITAADLTENRRVYETISIPRRSGFGSYGNQTALVILGDSIMNWSSTHIWDSDGQAPPHKGGGQWNRSVLAMLGNATGEGNEAQIEYFEKGARYALDSRTWDHLYFLCASGGHYLVPEHVGQNPLTQEAKESIDDWIQEYHSRIAIPAAERGASVIQMTYIYGCPQKDSGNSPEAYRAFSEYFTAKQREVALEAGFAIFDVYGIPQLRAPLPDFYADSIHPSPAGCRLIAQEFAASVAHPTSRAPRSLARPAISGTAQSANSLTCSRGSWAFSPTTYSYQWMRDATDIPGATSNTYTVTAQDIGYHLSCRVTASNALGTAERTSAHTTKVGQ